MQRAAVDSTAGRAIDPDRTDTDKGLSVARQAGWMFVRPEVRKSCSLALRRLGVGIRSIAVTSTIRGEGRTTVAVGLAVAASTEFRCRTVLLDLDLERRTIQKMTSVCPGPGVVEFLREETVVEDCLQRVDQHLEVVTAGVLLDPGALTGRPERLADLIGQLGDRCDLMIADLPPLGCGVTAARIAELFESVTMVVRAGGVSVADIERSASILSQRPVVILNGIAGARPSRIRKLLNPRP